MEFYIEEALAGKCVYDVLRREMGLSNRLLTRLKQTEDGITVNGVHATVRCRLAAGDRLCLALEDTTSSAQIVPVPLAVAVIAETADWIAVNKPAGMPTHPSHGHFTDTLANALAYRCAAEGCPFVFRPINRLDRNTSGVVLTARSQLAASRLGEAMRTGRMHKRYLALLDGEAIDDAGELTTYIRRTADSIITRTVCGAGEGGDLAVTAWRVLGRGGGRTLVEAFPRTGRTHQLRVHFACLGCPIYGDGLYGRAADNLDRHALHAVSLSFPRPEDGETVTLHAPLPEDLAALISPLLPDADLFGKDTVTP